MSCFNSIKLVTKLNCLSNYIYLICFPFKKRICNTTYSCNRIICYFNSSKICKVRIRFIITFYNKACGFFLNNNTRGLRELKVETDERFVNVTPDKALARPGSYQFEVIQLATKSSAEGRPTK